MTLFPELVERVLGESIIGRAQEAGFTPGKAQGTAHQRAKGRTFSPFLKVWFTAQ